MKLVSNYVYINKLDETVDKYNNIYPKANKMKTVDFKSGIYIDADIEHNDKDPKSKIGGRGKTGPKKLLQSEKLRILYHTHMLLLISMVKKLSEKELHKTN